MIHRTQIGRHDLIACLRVVPGAPVELLARFCGYDRAEVEPAEAPRLAQVEVRPPPPKEVPQPAEPAPARVELLCPVRATSRDPGKSIAEGRPRLECELLLAQGKEIRADELSSRDLPLPAKPPLQPWARLWPYVRRVLGRSRESHRLDTRPLLRLLANQRPITRLPCLRDPGWAGPVSVMCDRRLDLLPFWEDMETVLDRIIERHGREGIDIEWLQEGKPPGVPPRSGRLVLVLSDLGCLSGDPSLADAWLNYGRKLRRAGLPPTALLPCPRDRWVAELADLWHCACWDRVQRLPHGTRGLRPLPPATQAERARRADHLLTWLAPALRVEPGLLRAIRLLIPPGQADGEAGAGADVGTEYDAWHHPQAVYDPSAMGLRAQYAATRRAEHRDTVPDDCKAALVSLLRAWHESCSETIRTAEVLHLGGCGAPVSPEELDQARSTQNLATARLLRFARAGLRETAVAEGFRGWQQRGLARSSPAERETEESLAVAWAIFRQLDGEGTAQVPDGLNREWLDLVRQLLVGPGPEILWELRQAGSDLVLRPWQPGAEPSSLTTGAPLAWLRSCRPQFRVEIEETPGPAKSYDLLSLALQGLRHPIGSPRRLKVSSDCGEVELATSPRLPWARRFARDRFGLYAELDLNGVGCRLRWIPPGSFLMGSPQTEAGRFGDEGPQHLVTLSRGFWLGDTTCTQELWQAVMSKNPSHFKKPYDPKRPVESVSWEDCHQFCTRLRELVPDLEFRLPTEAEWEYACRAGTKGAFNDGSECTKPEGEDPALRALGWHAEGGKGQTHPVGGRSPNAWGLYDMHGNVWEWCADHADWKGKEHAFVTNTYVDGAVDPLHETGARRVVRGGSCWIRARVCRSAYRGTSGPGSRGRGLGFRLAAGQPPGRGAPSPAAGGAAALGPEAPAAPASGARRAVRDGKSKAPKGGPDR